MRSPVHAPRRPRPDRGRRRHVQQNLEFKTWGGKRKGAGRKPAGDRAGVPHHPRPTLERRLPLHVTLRMTRAVWNLR